MSMPRWMYLINPVAGINKQEIAREMEKPNHGTIGKYLFFSDDKNQLIDLGKKLLAKYDLYIAKVPLSNKPQSTRDKGFVLCIYDSTPKLENELAQYADDEKIIYQHWKSDADTLSNVL
jgi:hypothetical protein